MHSCRSGWVAFLCSCQPQYQILYLKGLTLRKDGSITTWCNGCNDQALTSELWFWSSSQARQIASLPHSCGAANRRQRKQDSHLSHEAGLDSAAQPEQQRAAAVQQVGSLGVHEVLPQRHCGRQLNTAP